MDIGQESPQQSSTSGVITKRERSRSRSAGVEPLYQSGGEPRQGARQGEAAPMETPTPTSASATVRTAPLSTGETPAVISTEPLLNIGEAQLASQSLTDDALQRLSWQMQRLALARGTPSDEWTRFELERARAACSTAQTIARLVKLKIDAYKAFREAKK